MERPVDWLPAINDDTVDCPPFAVVMATYVDPFGNIHFTRYDGSASPILFFNGQGVIPAVSSVPGAVGTITRTFPATAGYSGPGPSPGDTWGAVEDVWYIQPGVPGYTILGGAGLGAVNVVEQVTDTTEPQSVLKARVTATSLGAAYTRTGNTIVADADGALGTLDGVTMAVGNRVLLRSGNSSAGIYTIASLGSVSSKFVLNRSSDADTSAELPSGTLVTVSEGTTDADTLWMLTTNDPITLNTTSLVFTKIAPTSGTGITSINALTASAQFLAVGTAGTDFAVSSTTATHTFNLPDASLTARGVVTTGTQSINGIKTFDDIIYVDGPGGVSISYAGTGTDYYSTIGSYSTPAWGTIWQHRDFANTSLVSAVILTRDALAANGDATFLFSDSNPGATNPKFAIGTGVGISYGQTFTFAGLNVTGGIITGGTYTGGLSIGDPVGSGTSKGILFVDASGDLADSTDFEWDDTAKTLTLGTAGYLISTLASTPTLSTNSTIAGPYMKDF